MTKSIPIIGRLLLGFGVALLLASCASTSLVKVWQDPNYSGGPFKRILVIGVSEDSGNRQAFENIFVTELKKRGVEAIPSYTVLPQDGQLSKEEIEKAAQSVNADGFLVTRLTKSEKETQYSPSYVMSDPTIAYSAGFYTYYASAWSSYSAYATPWGGYSPPTVNQYSVVTLETNLWDARTQKLVWSGATQTFAPRKVGQEAPAFADLIIKDLAERKLIPASS